MPPDQEGQPAQPVSLEMIYYRLTRVEAALEHGLEAIGEKQVKDADRISVLEKDVIRLGERMTLFAAAQAVFATVAATVSAFIRK